MTLEALPVKTDVEYQKEFRDTLQGISQGTLNDFGSGSVLTLLSEIFALGFSSLDENLNREITDVVFGSIARLFGVSDVAGARAQIKLVFYPVNIDQVSSFVIESGFPVLVNGVVFRTDAQLSVNPGNLFAEVTATAVEVGKQDSVSPASLVSWQAIPGLSNVAISATNYLISPGSDPLDYSSATNALTGLLVNQALITVEDYEALLDQRFPGFVFSVIENLDKDKVTRRSGIIHIFGSTKDFNNLTEAQKLQVSTGLSDGWALVYVSDFNRLNLHVSVIADINPGSNPQEVALAINVALLSEYLPGNQKKLKAISLNDTIAAVYEIPGVKSVQYLSFDSGDGVYKAENVALQNLYTLVVIDKVKVQFEGVTGVFNYENV
jgi:hypothetical protein